jgi:hypothetical protein
LRELSLHILDVIEHSIRSGASVVSVAVEEKPDHDLLQIAVEDNRPGLSISNEKTYGVNPLGASGLNLFRAAAEQANGGLTVGKSALGGASVKAHMRLSQIDRKPLGDLAATLSSVVCTNPGLDLWCRFSTGGEHCEIKVSELAAEFGAGEQGGLALARKVSEKINEGLSAIGRRAQGFHS